MVGPVLLVAAGVVLLLLQLGDLQWSVALAWLSTWWPLVLVGAGLVLLTEWFLDTRRAGQNGGPLPRRTLGVSGVLVLVLLALAGPAVSGVYRGSDWARDRWHLPAAWGLDQVFVQHSETVVDLNAPLNRGGLLTVQNYRGNITVTGSSQDGQVHVSAHQRLSAWQEHELQDRQKRDRPVLEGSGNGLQLKIGGDGRDQTDLVIEIPHEAELRIEPEKGEIAVSELHGGVTVGNHEGNIVLTALNGDVRLAVHDDNADISGHSLSGNLTLDGRSGDISFSDIIGPLTLRGDFFGTTHLEHITGPVHFQSSFTDFTCAGIPGDMDIEGRSELRAHTVTGPINLTTTDRDITLSEIRNGVAVTNRKGSVKLSFLDLTAPISVTTSDGTIEMQVPEKAAFHVSAQTADGQIENDLGLSAEKHEDRMTLTGQVRTGGPAVQLKTSEGDIKVRRSETSSTEAASEATKDD